LKFELSKHAADVIRERNIPVEFIERVIDNPELKEPDATDDELEHYLSRIFEYDSRVLRVIINKYSVPKRVITAFFDRTMRGKL